jgi:DNA ligase (NAD+)
LNKNCGAIQKRKIYHFVSKKGFDIGGLGPKILDQLMDSGLVDSPTDLFELTQGDLLPLERFADKSAENLIKSINNHKKIALAKFIYALGIIHVGEETAIILAQKAVNKSKKSILSISDFLEIIRHFSLDEIQRIKDIGPIVGQSIYQYFKDEKNIRFLERLDDLGIMIEAPKKIVADKNFLGKVFVLTGELESLSRDQAKEKIRFKGGDVASSVSKNTDYVVAGKSPGSKYKTALKIGVKIINEQEFLNLMK